MRLEPNDIAKQLNKQMNQATQKPKGHWSPAWAILRQLYPDMPWYKLVWKWLFYQTNRELPLPHVDANEQPTVISHNSYPPDVLVARQYKANGKLINEDNKQAPPG